MAIEGISNLHNVPAVKKEQEHLNKQKKNERKKERDGKKKDEKHKDRQGKIDIRI